MRLKTALAEMILLESQRRIARTDKESIFRSDLILEQNHSKNSLRVWGSSTWFSALITAEIARMWCSEGFSRSFW
ncbi:hypothetical protein DsansV1_C30g0214491 [Dioscorea sansibarensis]